MKGKSTIKWIQIRCWGGVNKLKKERKKNQPNILLRSSHRLYITSGAKEDRRGENFSPVQGR